MGGQRGGLRCGRRRGNDAPGQLRGNGNAADRRTALRRCVPCRAQPTIGMAATRCAGRSGECCAASVGTGWSAVRFRGIWSLRPG
jgi:hypothetical protein